MNADEKFFIGLCIIFGVLCLAESLPSDFIQTAPLPGRISLSGTVTESAKAIDATNPELTAPIRWGMAALGYYNSEKVVIDQDAEAPTGVPEKLLNFSEQTPAIPASVGNASLENVTIINETMVWL